MRKFIVAVVLLLGVVFILWRVSEVQAIIDTLRRMNVYWLIAGILIVGAYLLTVASTFRSIYKAIGLYEDFKNLIVFSTAAIFLNTVAPSAGMSGMAVFVFEARRRKYSVGRAAIAGALFVLFDYAAFICILFIGLFILFRRNNLNVGAVTASVILVSIALFIAFLVYLGMRSEDQLAVVLGRLARIVNRIVRPFIHREYLSEQRAHVFAHEAAEGLREIDEEPKKMLEPFLLALLKQSLMVMLLWFSFLAFAVQVSPGTVVAGYSIGYLFTIVSPTPAGLGLVEGMLSLALASMNIPLGTATVVTLAYRAYTFWLPLLVGMFAFRSLGKTKEINSTVVEK